ncbi:MAG: glycosyltransferase family 9 protein [Myxococcaceae bacterium]|nr:glycosyltransferase family 9 protein [Myxococcaceae bacterium]
MLHRVEVFLRHVVGWLLALAWWRPWRSGRKALLRAAKRVVLVRVDNRVGEALLTTPLVQALAKTHEVHLVVHPKCARVLDGLPGLAGLHVFERGWLWRGSKELASLQQLATGAVVVNAASWVEYSGTPALAARRIGAHGCVVGPAVGPSRLLMDVAVTPRADTRNEVAQRLHLLSPLVDGPAGSLAFRTPRVTPAVEALLAAHPSFAVVNPGGRLDERRVPPAVFALVTRALVAQGLTPVVTWGPGEEALARDVVAGGSGVVAPPTSLDELAALMAGARVVICNNTGPMHLSVAVGARTVALFWKMPVEQWGHSGRPHTMLDLTAEPDAEAMARRVAEVVSGGPGH